jgi:hypothetical protein
MVSSATMILEPTSTSTNTGSNANTNINCKMARGKKNNKLFLLSWDMYGLESILDLTTLENLHKEEEQFRMLRILSDPEAKDPGNRTGEALNRTVQSLLLRARVNSQRHYEVYTIQVDPSISEQQIKDMFADTPQQAADLVRERGNRLYSNRQDVAKVVIV